MKRLYWSFLAALGLLAACNVSGPSGPCCVSPPAGLVAWWPLDEMSGTAAQDIAGVPNNGVHFNGPTPTLGKVAAALRFDGVDDYVRVPDHPELNVGTGSFTLDAWVRTTASSGVVVLVDKRTGTGFATTAQGYSLFLGNGRLGFQMANGVGSGFCTPAPGGSSCVNYGSTGPNVADGQWHHVAAVVDRSDPKNGVRLYVDGNLVFTGAPLSGDLNNTSDLYIGVRTPGQGGGGFFPGDLDELELFKRALSQNEIQQIYKADLAGKCKPRCVPPPAKMTAWWPLEGTGNDIWDGHSGTLQGSPTPVPGYVGLALDFTGGYVEIPDHPDFHVATGELTIDAWIRAKSGVAPNDADEIVWKRTGGPSNTGFSFQLSGASNSPGQLQFAASFNGTLITAVTGGPNLRDDQWHHVAVTLKSGGQVVLYVDGVQVAAAPAGTFSNLANPEPLRIGMPSAAWYPQTSFRGVIDEVELFNRALTQQEIQNIYKAGPVGKCK